MAKLNANTQQSKSIPKRTQIESINCFVAHFDMKNNSTNKQQRKDKTNGMKKKIAI